MNGANNFTPAGISAMLHFQFEKCFEWRVNAQSKRDASKIGVLMSSEPTVTKF